MYDNYEIHRKRSKMKGLLKPFYQILEECEYYNHKEGSHYWTFFYNLDGRVIKLGFRDFYKSYFDTEVTIRPKYDRKKRVMTDRVEVLAKNENYLMDAMKCWFQFFHESDDNVSQDLNIKERSWDELFEI